MKLDRHFALGVDIFYLVAILKYDDGERCKRRASTAKNLPCPFMRKVYFCNDQTLGVRLISGCFLGTKTGHLRSAFAETSIAATARRIASKIAGDSVQYLQSFI